MILRMMGPGSAKSSLGSISFCQLRRYLPWLEAIHNGFNAIESMSPQKSLSFAILVVKQAQIGRVLALTASFL